MRIASRALIALIALEHAWFLVLEMFLFKTPYGPGKALQVGQDYS